MSSFLEKLKKGTKTKNAGAGQPDDSEEKEADENEEINEEEDTEESPVNAENGEETEAEDENEEEEKEDEEEKEEVKAAKPKKAAAKKTKAAPVKMENLEIKAIPAAIEEEKEAPAEKNDEWLETEGQLSVDVYQTENELVIQSAIAGIKTEDLDVLVEDDVLTIKGKRLNPYQADSLDYFIQECYWGPFSRKIILPVEVDASRTDASMKEGILTIRLPKIQREKKKKITIKG